MDAIVISHATALHAIRHARTIYRCLPWEPLTYGEQRKVLKHATSKASLIDLEYLERLGITEQGAPEPLDLIVGDPLNRRHNRRCTCHVATKPLPSGSLLKIADGIYCASPALTAAQLSLSHSLPETAMLLLEFLGTYSMPAAMPAKHNQIGDQNLTDQESQVIFKCDPATTVSSVEAIAKWASSSSYSSYRSSPSFIAEGSASPMESLVYAMLGFPMRLGGFGCANLPKGGMLLNHRIDFDAKARQLSSGVPYAICDCYIPSAKIDLEYNGFYHDDQRSRIHDECRNNGLKAMGITVLTVNYVQAQDLDALEAMAQLIYGNAGRRFRYQHNGYRTMQRNLLAEIRHAICLA